MSFTVRLGSDLVPVEAGATVPLTVEVANRAETQDRFELEIEGLDPEWTAVPVPTFTISAGETQGEKVFFKPPRMSESLAGNYPFVVKVRSLESGEQRTVQGVLQIKPYHHVTMEIAPKRGTVTPFRPQEVFAVTLVNLGNTEHTLQLFGNDPDDACAYQFDQEQITLGPGQTKVVNVSARPTEKHTFASSRLHVFSISSRSIETPSVMATAQAQLEVRPILSPTAMVAIVLFVLLAAGWLALRPKPPKMNLLSLDAQGEVGKPLQISWGAANANKVAIKINGEVIRETPDLDGSMSYTPKLDGNLVVEAQAFGEGRESDPIQKSSVIAKPAPVPDPEIEAFRITPTKLKVGQTFVVYYRLNSAVTKATLSPPGEDLNLKVNERELTASRPGEIIYRLVAENAAGKTVEKKFRVVVVETSDASIVKFDVTPTTLPDGGGTVTITWQLNNAQRAELKVGTETVVLESPSGSRELTLSESATITLIGYDSQGRTVSQKREIKVATLEPTPPPSDPAGTTTGGTGTTGTGP